MKVYLIALTLIATMLTACNKPLIINDGPALARIATTYGTKYALTKSNATVDEAAKVKAYVQEAEKFIHDGSAPSTALDDLATYLNEHISNDTVKMVIQQGIEMLKRNVAIPPPDGVIPSDVKSWVYAVLGGVADGCTAYINGQTENVAPRLPNSVNINFR